jgi:hypothetical protein
MTHPSIGHASRRRLMTLMLSTAVAALAATPAFADADPHAERFEFLSKNGNSNCSPSFLASIQTMPEGARLQGSCCGPMALHRYGEQIEGLKKYAGIAEIPPDPYDVEALLARRLLAAYDAALAPEQQAIYDQAMTKAAEGGPCCCKCWRWHVFGGLGKLLIREHGFDATRVAKVWDLSTGCGGDEHTHQ